MAPTATSAHTSYAQNSTHTVSDSTSTSTSTTHRSYSHPSHPSTADVSHSRSSLSSSSSSSSSFISTHVDSAQLLWDDIDRTRFYSILTCASAAIRTVIYPAALIKTCLMQHTQSQSHIHTPSHQPVSTSIQKLSHRVVTNVHTTVPLNPLNPSLINPAPASVITPYPYRVPGAYDTFRCILKRDGIFGLYRGFKVNMIGLACDPLNIGTMEWCRTQLTQRWIHTDDNDKHHHYSASGVPGTTNSFSHFFFKYCLSPTTCVTFVSAGIGAIVASLLQVPVDVVSQKKQIQIHEICTPHWISRRNARHANNRMIHDSSHSTRPNVSSSPLNTHAAGTDALSLAQQIIRTEGWLGMYRGFGITVCSAIPFNSVLWSVYWPCQSFLYDTLCPPGSDSKSQSHPLHVVRASVPTPVAAFVGSATAILVTQPIDVIKTRLQVHGGIDATIMKTIKKLLHERGYRGLMSGFYPRLVAVTPQMTIMMSSYEYIKRYCKKDTLGKQ